VALEVADKRFLASDNESKEISGSKTDDLTIASRQLTDRGFARMCALSSCVIELRETPQTLSSACDKT
jgi:hypothetical protein